MPLVPQGPSADAKAPNGPSRPNSFMFLVCEQPLKLSFSFPLKTEIDTCVEKLVFLELYLPERVLKYTY